MGCTTMSLAHSPACQHGRVWQRTPGALFSPWSWKRLCLLCMACSLAGRAHVLAPPPSVSACGARASVRRPQDGDAIFPPGYAPVHQRCHGFRVQRVLLPISLPASAWNKHTCEARHLHNVGQALLQEASGWQESEVVA